MSILGCNLGQKNMANTMGILKKIMKSVKHEDTIIFMMIKTGWVLAEAQGPYNREQSYKKVRKNCGFSK